MRQGRQDATVVAKYNERMHQARHGPVFPNREAKRKWQATPRDKEEYFILSPVSMCSGFPTASLDIHFHRAGWRPLFLFLSNTSILLVCRVLKGRKKVQLYIGIILARVAYSTILSACLFLYHSHIEDLFSQTYCLSLMCIFMVSDQGS